MTLVCGAAALALAACSKGGDKTAAAGAPAAGDAAKTASADLGGPPPSRKGGLWEQTMAFNGMKQTLSMCVDEASEQKTRWWSTERRGASSGGMDCSEQKVSRKLTGGWTIHSVCKEPNGMTVTSDGEATGDFGTTYHVDITTVTTGSSMPEANGTHHMVMDGAWKGPCPAGMAAGDMVMPGGMRMSAHGGVTGANGGPPSEAEIAKMRAQAMEMAKKYKEGSQ
jgi:hypothetical protein